MATGRPDHQVDSDGDVRSKIEEYCSQVDGELEHLLGGKTQCKIYASESFDDITRISFESWNNKVTIQDFSADPNSNKRSEVTSSTIENPQEMEITGNYLRVENDNASATYDIDS